MTTKHPDETQNAKESEDDSPRSEENRAGKSWRPRLGMERWILRLLLAGLALGALTFAVLEYWAGREMERSRALLVSRGISLDPATFLEELEPDEPNGSHALGAMTHLLLMIPERGSEGAGPSPLVDHDLAEALGDPALLASTRAWLGHPARGMVLDVLDWSVDTVRASSFHRGSGMRLPTVMAIAGERVTGALRLRDLLRARALIEMADGNPDAAFGAAISLLRVGHWLQMESPSILTWIVGNALASKGLELGADLMALESPSTEVRDRFRSELERFGGQPLSWGLEADLMLSHQELRRGLVLARDTPPSFVGFMTRASAAWVENAFHARSLATYGTLVDWSRMDPTRRPDPSVLTGDPSMFMIPSRILVPNLLDSIAKTDALHMRMDLFRVALAWEDYRQQQGTYPESPEALVPDFLPELPTDRFDAGALRQRAESDHLLIYSVGVDRRDDGGVDRGTPQTDDEDDIAWRLPLGPVSGSGGAPE